MPGCQRGQLRNEALILALGRTHRWERLLDDGKYRSAEAEGVTCSYVNRLLRLTLLAPDIVEAILEGRQPKAIQLKELTRPVPSDWQEQRRRLPHSRSEPERASNIDV